MNPDDPRHGSTRGYHAGCRERCCLDAIARYEKQGRVARQLYGGRAVPAIGAQRRIQALMALGWTGNDIAAAAGYKHRNHLHRILVGQNGKPCTWLERKTHDTIRAVFEELSMRLPERTPVRARTATMARRRGWLPPLAWDDIDNPNERPNMSTSRHRSRDDVDEVIVLRLLDGVRVEHSTKAERDEAMRRWLAWGRPEDVLCRIHGWHDGRYGRDAA